MPAAAHHATARPRLRRGTACLAAFALLAWAGACVPARAGDAAAAVSEQAVRLGGLDAVVWLPPDAASGKLPLLLFSHGFHGCATQSRFLMEAFAQAGYLVAAPNHRDATCHGGAQSWGDRPAVPFKQPEQWSADSFRDRADDLRSLLEALRADPRFAPRADFSRIGLVGHSLGGYTVLGLAGAWPGWKLDGVRAVLALSPYSQPFVQHHTLGRLDAPVMYQGGTRDFGVTPTLHKSAGAYDQSPAPKYYVEFRGAGHLAWTDLGRRDRQAIVDYSLAFLDRYLRGAPAAAILAAPAAEVAELRSQGG
ncbi:MAG: alpha/beta hydrolase [Nevskia sp.]|nr:alpha/beta hydrolase [Nevskia sp.]